MIFSCHAQRSLLAMNSNLTEFWWRLRRVKPFSQISATDIKALGTVTQDLTPLYQRKNNRTSNNAIAITTTQLPHKASLANVSPNGKLPRPFLNVESTRLQQRHLLAPRLTLFQNPPNFSSTTSAIQSTETSRSIQDKTSPCRQPFNLVPDVGSKKFVPPSRYQDPDPPLQNHGVSSRNFQSPNLVEDSLFSKSQRPLPTSPPTLPSIFQKQKLVRMSQRKM